MTTVNNRVGTGPITRPQTQPLPADHLERLAEATQQPPEQAPEQAPRGPGRDTAEFRGSKSQAPKQVDIESFDQLGSELIDTFNEKLGNSALDGARGILNAPGAVLHAVQVGEMLLRNPSAAGEMLQGLTEDPMGTAEAVAEAVGEFKDGAEAIATTAGVVKDAAANTVRNVREHGLVQGTRQSITDASQLAKQHVADIQENFRGDSGAGLSNVARELTERTAERTEKQVTKALMREVYSDPDLAPKGFVGGVKRLLSNASEAVDGVTGKVVDFADNLADKAADALANNAVGRKVLDAIDFVNPARHVSADALEAATKAGTAEGLQAAGEAVAQTLQKAGHSVVTDGAGTITKVVSSTGKEVAIEAFEAAAKEGLEAAAKEAAQAGASAAAKGLGRFAPGVNIAIAAYDTYHAAEVWADPDSTAWQKGMATATAIGSALAATNIPIVSQVGAVASLGTSVLENVSPEMLAAGAKAVGGAVGNAAKAVGQGAAKVARAAVEAPAKVVRAVGTTAVRTVQAVGATATRTVQAVGATAARTVQAVGNAASSAARSVTDGAKSAVKSVSNFVGGLFG